MGRWLAVIPSLFVACTSAEPGEIDVHARCVALRDHEIDTRLADAPDVDAVAHRQAMRQALGERFIDECNALTSKQVDCALVASTADAIAICRISK